MPTTTRTARRRGKRGGQRHRAKCTPQTSHDEHKNESVEELCRRLFALNLKDHKPEKEHGGVSKNHVVDLTRPSAAFSPESVRHHWAPQFRPDSPPGPSSCSIRKGKTTTQIQPLQISERPLFFPSSSATQEKLRSWTDEPQGLPLFAPFTSLDPQGRDGLGTTVTKGSCKNAQAFRSQHAKSSSRAEDLSKEAGAAATNALVLNNLKSASSTAYSQSTKGIKRWASGVPDLAMTDERTPEVASLCGAPCSWPSCITRAAAGEIHDCKYEEYITMNRAYSRSSNEMLDSRTDCSDASTPPGGMPPVVPNLRAREPDKSSEWNGPSRMTRPVDIRTQRLTPVLPGLGAQHVQPHNPTTSTGHHDHDPHYFPLSTRQASRNLLERRHRSLLPIKAEVKKTFDDLLARHNTHSTASNAAATTQASDLPCQDQEPAINLTSSPARTSEYESLQPCGSRDPEQQHTAAAQVKPTRTRSSHRSISSFKDVDDHLQISDTFTPSVSDDWENVEILPSLSNQSHCPPSPLIPGWLFQTNTVDLPNHENHLMSWTPSSPAQASTPDDEYDYAYSPIDSRSDWDSPSSLQSISRVPSPAPELPLPSPSMSSSSSGLQ